MAASPVELTRALPTICMATRNSGPGLEAQSDEHPVLRWRRLLLLLLFFVVVVVVVVVVFSLAPRVGGFIDQFGKHRKYNVSHVQKSRPKGQRHRPALGNGKIGIR